MYVLPGLINRFGGASGSRISHEMPVRQYCIPYLLYQNDRRKSTTRIGNTVGCNGFLCPATGRPYVDVRRELRVPDVVRDEFKCAKPLLDLFCLFQRKFLQWGPHTAC